MLRSIPFKDFVFLSIAVITGFWCLTSRVLIYYLFPVIPLFAAWLALEGNRSRLVKLVPWGVGLSCVVLVGGLVGGMFFSDKMEGAKTRFHPGANHYAYEFYHGRKSDEELAKWRKARDEWLLQMKARKAAEREAAK